MRTWITPCILAILLPLMWSTAGYSLSPHEVLVVYNTDESVVAKSKGVADYYAVARCIPSKNIVGFQFLANEDVAPLEYQNTIAAELNSYLSLPENAHIKVIVLCYGIPSHFSNPVVNWGAVDSSLTILGNPGVPENPHHQLRITNPYCGKEVDFATFRNLRENAVTKDGTTWKLNYLVCRLEAYESPTVTVNVNGRNV